MVKYGNPGERPIIIVLHRRRKSHGADPLDDYLAVISLGTYPTPTPSDAERAAFAVSYGLIETL